VNVITADQIHKVCLSTAKTLGQDGMESSLFVGDYDYACMAEDGLRRFGERFSNFLFSSGLNTYAEERNDCDDYALHAASFAKIDHTKFYLGEEAVAFGIAWVVTDTMLHAVNAVIHLDESGQPYLHLCEPQNTWNDKKVIGKPYMTMREFPLSSVRRWQLLCF
jgi:hypothetical protein